MGILFNRRSLVVQAPPKTTKACPSLREPLVTTSDCLRPAPREKDSNCKPYHSKSSTAGYLFNCTEGKDEMTSLATTLLINSLSEQAPTPSAPNYYRTSTHPKYMQDHPAIIFNTPIHSSDITTTGYLDDEDYSSHPPVMPTSTSQNEGPFWQSIDGCLESEAEKIVVYCFFLYGMSAFEIYTMYPSKFRDSQQVAEIKRKVLLSIG